MDTVTASNNDTKVNSNSHSQEKPFINNSTMNTMNIMNNPNLPKPLPLSSAISNTSVPSVPVPVPVHVPALASLHRPQQPSLQPPALLNNHNHQSISIHNGTNHTNGIPNNNISPLPLNTPLSHQFSSTKTPHFSTTTNSALPPPPSLTKTTPQTNTNSATPNIQRNNQNLFQSLYNPNVSGIPMNTPNILHTTPIHPITPIHTMSTTNHHNPSPSPLLHKTASYPLMPQDTKVSLRRGRPKKSSHSHRKAFEAGHPRFERALQQLIEMRQKHPQGLLPSIRGFMQTIHMGFANTNAVVKYYANNYLNMTLDDFKRDYMVIRRVRAKSRNNSGGRPKKTSQMSGKMKYDDKTDSSGSDSDEISSRNRSAYHRKRSKAPLQPLKHQDRERTGFTNYSAMNAQTQQLQQQFLMNQFASSATNNHHGHNGHNIDFNFPLFFEGIANNEGHNGMPKLIADSKTGHDIHMRDVSNVKLEECGAKTRASEFVASEFIAQLENDLALLMELQDTNNGGVNTVSPEDIKKPLSVVRKRLLTMLDRSLYHQLDHQQKVTIAKANLIAGICTAAIHTGYCKDALALYRQSLTLFRELNSDAVSNGYPMDAHNDDRKSIDSYILSLIANCNSNEQDPGKYSMFIVVIYYQMSLLYDKSLIEKVQKSRYYLIQALNLLVRENAMNSNKYCIETLQRLALFALETGKDEEYISMMLITLKILRECDENRAKILDVEIHFAKNLLSYGQQLPNTNNALQRQRFEAVKSEYQTLLTQIITDAKQDNLTINTETRRTLSKLLELAKFLLDYNQLNESYKVYHCMRKMCDDTQINLDLDFMKIWIQFVKTFITQIVKHNANNNVIRHGNNAVLWSEQILELCEFDVKVLEKIQQTTDIQIGTDIYQEYIACTKALIAVNIHCDKQIICRCKSYLEKASNSPNEEIKAESKALLESFAKQNDE